MEVPTVEVREVIKQVSKPEASNAAHVRQDTELGCKGQVAKERCRCLNATDSVRSCRAFAPAPSLYGTESKPSSQSDTSPDAQA